MTVRETVDQAPEVFYDLNLSQQIVTLVLSNSAGTQAPSIARPARETKDLMKEREPWASDEAVQSRL